jgi:hypothetical protein
MAFGQKLQFWSKIQFWNFMAVLTKLVWLYSLPKDYP